MLYPWHSTHWDELTGRLRRLPHALLFAGPAGTGKTAFAEAFAALLLCEAPTPESTACGECPSCRWLVSGNHPDFRLVAPEADLASDESEGEDEESRTPEPASRQKKASSQIVIAQIRALADFIAMSTHRHGRRVVMIRPADAMNAPTANALLKLLEEPTPSTYFILITSAPMRLLPTIRSRCQRVTFHKPEQRLALEWLRANNTEEADGMLALAGGMPLAAADLADEEMLDYRRRFIADLGGRVTANPLQVAATWEAWLRAGKDGRGAIDMTMLVAWLQKWVIDLALVKQRADPIYHPALKPALQTQGERAVISNLLACYNDLLRVRAVAQHPLNPRLFLEDMLLRYARAIGS